MYGEVCKGASRNSATFRMALFATIGDAKKLQRASSDGLTINCLLKFAEHLLCQTPLDARFNKNNCLSSILILHHHLSINFQRTFTSSNLTRNNRTRNKICSKLKRKTPERRQLTVFHAN